MATKSILLTEDDRDLLSIAAKILREAGYVVTEANNGADALCRLKEKPSPDLLILDMVMPGMDGDAVLKALGPTAPPVLVITGAAVETTIPKIRTVVRVLPKPFDRDQLLATVGEILTAIPSRENAVEAKATAPKEC